MYTNRNPFGGNQFGNQNPFDDLLKKKKEKEKEPEAYDSNGKKIRKKPPYKRMVAALIVIFAVITGMNSYYVLDEDNYAVVTTLGNPQAVSKAGLHFKIPYVQNVRLVSKIITGMPIGYDIETKASIDEESVMITKDFNFVNTDFYLEYMVSDPVKYLYASQDPEATLKMLAQSYIRDTVGIYTVDDVITTGKAAIQSEIKEKLTNRMIQEDIGLSVVNITIQDAFPPTEEVMNAFKNVENAKQGKETAINNANKYRNEKLPEATAQTDKILQEAESSKVQRVNEANAEVAKFNAMYEEYSKNPEVTRKRMFYEAMEDVLPGMKVIIDGTGKTDTILPLDSFTGAAGAAASQNAGNSATGQNSLGNSTGERTGNDGKSGMKQGESGTQSTGSQTDHGAEEAAE